MRRTWWSRALVGLFAALAVYVFLPDFEPVAGQDKAGDKKEKKRKTISLLRPRGTRHSHGGLGAYPRP